MEGTRSHHVRIRCRIPGCEAVVCDIRRHLMVHVKAEQINQADVEGIAEVMRHGKRKHVIARGNPQVRGSDKKKIKKKKKWCPVANCTTVCSRLDKHLTRKHKNKPGSNPYKIYLKEAKPYLGMVELTEASPVVATVEDQPSTSSAAPPPIEEPHDEPCQETSSSGSDGTCPPSDLESSSSSSSEGYQPPRMPCSSRNLGPPVTARGGCVGSSNIWPYPMQVTGRRRRGCSTHLRCDGCLK